MSSGLGDATCVTLRSILDGEQKISLSSRTDKKDAKISLAAFLCPKYSVRRGIYVSVVTESSRAFILGG